MGGVGEPVGVTGIGANNASLRAVSLHRAAGRALPLRGRCLSTSVNHIWVMCGRVIQSSAPIRYAIVDGMNVRDSRVHNYPPRWNGAPSQDLLVIRRNHKTGEVSLDPLRWGLIPYWCEDPKGWPQADQREMRDRQDTPFVSGGLS